MPKKAGPASDMGARERIVAYDGGHLQVVACAGAGKTETMARRVARLIADGVQPAGIIAFTFTNAAADALKARILRKVQEVRPDLPLDRLSPMFVGTIHAWCLRFLQERVPKYATYDLFEDHRLIGLLTREYWELGLQEISTEKRLTTNIELFLGTAAAVQNELLDPRKLPKNAFRKVYERYLDMLDRYRVLTHDQCIARAVEALNGRGVVDELWATLRHVVVDEFQDVNPAQAKLVKLLGQDPVHVCVVGDDDQSIYQWRGSSVKYIQRFAREFGAHKETLAKNYRSVPAIVRLGAGFAEAIPGHMQKAIESHREDKQRSVQMFVADTAQREAELVADAVARLHGRGVPMRDVAILLRSVRTSAALFVEALEDCGLRAECAGRSGLFLEREARALGLAYTWLAGEDQFYDAREHGFADCDLSALVGELCRAFEVPSPRGVRLGQWLRRWKEDAFEAREADLIPGYYALLRELGVHTLNADDAADAARLGTLARFSQLLVDFEAVTRRARTMREDGAMRGGLAGGEKFLEKLGKYIGFYAQHEYDAFEGEPGLGVDAVTISTVHAAKGLEWPVVFVPAMSAKRFPSSKTGQQRTWLISRKLFPAERYEGSDSDERRLFYVALTRARDLLVVSTHEHVTKNSVGRSPYFEEIGGAEIEPTSKPIPLPKWKPERDDAAKEIPTFSFSEIAAYLACPKSYRYRERFGFGPPAVKELGYGKSVHHVLRRVAEETRNTGRVPRDGALDAIFASEFYLPYADRPSHEKMVAHARELVSAYAEHFEGDLHRVWEVERSFELHLDSANVTGRADVILDHEDGCRESLALVDYKTTPDPGSDRLAQLQLRVYAAAARGEGLDVRGAYLHELGAPPRDARTSVAIDPAEVAEALKVVAEAAEGIRVREFPSRPSEGCGRCDVKFVCEDCPGRRARFR